MHNLSTLSDSAELTWLAWCQAELSLQFGGVKSWYRWFFAHQTLLSHITVSFTQSNLSKTLKMLKVHSLRAELITKSL